VGVSAFITARDQLLRADRAERSELCAVVVESFHQLARFDWAAVMTTDPETHLPSGGAVEGFSPDDCAPFWDNELLDPDFNKFSDLAQRSDPVATLHHTVDGDLMRSPRYVKVFSPLGAIDELRVAFVAGSSCLGVGVFVRSEDDGPFAREELADVRQLIPVVTGVLRRALGRGIEKAYKGKRVVVVLDESDEVVAVTPGGWQLLDDLRTQPVDAKLPGLVAATAAKVRAHRIDPNVTTRLRDRNGHWIRVDAAPIEGEKGMVALTMAPALADDLVGVLLDFYGLTARETEIALCVCRGLSTKDIAAELAISAHTVKDHMKVVFAKAGVSTRGELMASLLTNHVFDRFHVNTTHMPGTGLHR
jgi:DNA-binding CsgD family transcriptional regulator